MSEAAAREFMSRVVDDDRLRAEVTQTVGAAEDPASAVARVARANGFEVDPGDLRLTSGAGELSDEALDQVSGGAFADASSRGIIVVGGKPAGLDFGSKGIIIIDS